MFGISPLGWLHTLGSLPAIPLAIYMLAAHGRITPRTAAGRIYFVSMLIGALTVFLVARQPESAVIGAATLVLLLAGYAVGYIKALGRASRYMETIFLSLTAFLLMVPAVSETLRRVPDGNPIAKSLDAPILLGAQGALVVMLVLGVTAQVIWLRRHHQQVS